MISKHILKEVILSNEDFILKQVGEIVKREGIDFPDDLKKTKDENDLFFPIQVCFELHQENIKREINGLIEACKRLGKNEGTLLTQDEEKIMTENGYKIAVLPVWKWLIVSDTSFRSGII